MLRFDRHITSKHITVQHVDETSKRHAQRQLSFGNINIEHGAQWLGCSSVSCVH